MNNIEDTIIQDIMNIFVKIWNVLESFFDFIQSDVNTTWIWKMKKQYENILYFGSEIKYLTHKSPIIT